jgi:hypothetical protein
MGLKKHVTTFVSNWLGVIIAAVIVLVSAGFGGMYLYGSNRIDAPINSVTGSFNLRYPAGLTSSGTSDDPPGYIYHLVFQVFNLYADSVEMEVKDLTLYAEGYSFPVTPDGTWKKTVATGYETIEGDITIDTDIFSALVEKEIVDITVVGTISGNGQYAWIHRQAEYVLNIPISGVVFQMKRG